MIDTQQASPSNGIGYEEIRHVAQGHNKTHVTSALLAVAKSLGWIEKRGRNEAQKYDYVQAADVAAELREKLYAAGIFVSATVGLPITKEYEGNNLKKVRITTVLVSWCFTDTASGEFLIVNVPGEAMDAGDKAIYKAMTGSLKYALMLNFLLPTGDDPEKDSAADEVYTAKAVSRATQAPPQRASPPARTATRAAPDTNAGPYAIPFGKHKGKAMSAVPTDDLDWLARAMERSIADPTKSKFKEDNTRLLDAMTAELSLREEIQKDEQQEPEPGSNG